MVFYMRSTTVIDLQCSEAEEVRRRLERGERLGGREGVTWGNITSHKITKPYKAYKSLILLAIMAMGNPTFSLLAVLIWWLQRYYVRCFRRLDTCFTVTFFPVSQLVCVFLSCIPITYLCFSPFFLNLCCVLSRRIGDPNHLVYWLIKSTFLCCIWQICAVLWGPTMLLNAQHQKSQEAERHQQTNNMPRKCANANTVKTP